MTSHNRRRFHHPAGKETKKMTNELLWLLEIPAIFLMIILAYRWFGQSGLILWIPLSVIIANILVVQTVRLFGFSATLGNAAYAATFLITDILSENHGRQAARRAVWMGFFSLLAMTLLMQLTIRFQPLPGDGLAGETQAALATIFSLLPRIAVASLIAYLVSQRHDVWAFHFWKTRFPSPRMLWVRNNLSTMVSQLMDSALFVLIAFWNVFDTRVLLEIFLTTYIFKWLIAAADTPFVYWARHMAAAHDSRKEPAPPVSPQA